MTIFFASNQADDFSAVNNTVGAITETTSTSFFNSSIVNSAISINTNNSVRSPYLGLLSNVWFHMDRYRETVAANFAIHSFEDTNGILVVRFRQNSGSNSTAVIVECFNGTTWVATTVQGAFDAAGVNNRIDISIRIETTPTPTTFVDYYVNGILILGGSVPFAIAPISYMVNGASFNALRFSQVIVADESTLNMRFYSNPPIGAGASQDFSGTFANIDDPILDQNDFISTSNNNAVSTFTAAARPLAGFAIRAVVVSANARRGVGGPQSIQLVIRQNGVNYFGPTIPLTLGFGKYNRIMELNPATNLPWTDSEAASAALEFGVKSIA